MKNVWKVLKCSFTIPGLSNMTLGCKRTSSSLSCLSSRVSSVLVSLWNRVHTNPAAVLRRSNTNTLTTSPTSPLSCCSKTHNISSPTDVRCSLTDSLSFRDSVWRILPRFSDIIRHRTDLFCSSPPWAKKNNNKTHAQQQARRVETLRGQKLSARVVVHAGWKGQTGVENTLFSTRAAQIRAMLGKVCKRSTVLKY